MSLVKNENSQLPAQRQQQILLLLAVEGQVLATELSQKFGISEDTARRDLRELAKAGKVTRVHGGAVLKASDSGVEYQERQVLSSEVKSELASIAISLLQPGQVIILDAGTSNQEIAKQLPADMELTVVTNCPHIAIAASAHPKTTVIMSGGQLNKSMQALTGVGAVETFHRINADLCFVGVCGLSLKAGVSTNNEAEAYVKRAMLASSAERIAVASADKLGAIEPYKVSDLEALTYLITEKGVTEEQAEAFKAKGLTVLTP